MSAPQMNELYAALGVDDAALRRRERDAAAKGALDSDAWDLLVQIAEGSHGRDWWQHRAAQLVNEANGETNACPVVACSHCREEYAAAVEQSRMDSYA